jgi:hypothetical protein
MGLSFSVSSVRELLRKTLHVVVIFQVSFFILFTSIVQFLRYRVEKKKQKDGKSDNKGTHREESLSLTKWKRLLFLYAGPSNIHWRNEPRQPAVINISTAPARHTRAKNITNVYVEAIWRCCCCIVFSFFLSLHRSFLVCSPLFCAVEIFSVGIERDITDRWIPWSQPFILSFVFPSKTTRK